MEHTEESLKEYNEFMTNYRIEHECCPKCGSIEHTTTLMGNIKNGNNYKNLNQCVCVDCLDVHTCHERVKTNTSESIDIITEDLLIKDGWENTLIPFIRTH